MGIKMAHYAFIDSNSIVFNVIVGINETETIDGLSTESWYGRFSASECKRTSYNTQGGVNHRGGEPYRKNFAGIGYIYDFSRDAFIPPKPFPSWLIDEETCFWKAPIPCPQNGKMYSWDEVGQQWVEI